MISPSRTSPMSSGPRILRRWMNEIGRTGRAAVAIVPGWLTAIDSLIAHPWIEERIGEVDDEVDDDDEGGGDHRDCLHDGVIPGIDGREDQLPHPRNREDRLNDHRAADQCAEL